MELLYSLLRVALETESPAPRHFPSLDKSGWESLLAASDRQTVTGLVTDAITRLGGLDIPEAICDKLMVRQIHIERRSCAVQQQANQFTAALRAEGLSPQVLKGPSVAAYYPRPEVRVSGDIDLYLPPEQIPAAVAFLEKQGLVAHKTPDDCFFFPCKPADIDLHGNYYDLRRPAERLLPVPSAQAELLMLSAHIFKHAIGPGVGLRQLCDMAMAFRALEGKYDPAALEKAFDLVGLERWNRLLCAFLKERLGVETPLYKDKNPVDISPLEKIVWRGGDFGHHTAMRKKALQRRPFQRKLDTARLMLQRMPFGLRYGAHEYLAYLWALARGNT